MADALVSIVLEQLDTIISREVEQELRLVIGVENEVQKLSHIFRIIQRVLADAETRQLRENDVKLWLDDLRDICYEMDDVLDEWSTEINKSKLDHQVGEDDQEHARPKRKSNVHYFLGYSSWFRWFPGYSSWFGLSKVSLRHDIAHRIKNLHERLEDVAKENDSRHRLAVSDTRSNEQLPNHSTTTAFFDKTEVQGRVQDRNKLRDMLLCESSEMQNLRTISVVGMGGLGKTTLARLVYDDDEIKENFGKRIWVCVPDPFDVIKIANAILESLTSQASTSGVLQSIMQQIQHHLRGQRFLLVLDDVWNEDREKWKSLRDGLVNCGLGTSTILVTTRKRNVAIIMGCTESDIFQPGLLSSEACWSIFSKIALSGRTNYERQQLGDIGKQIVKTHCKGLPLAAKTLGGLLCFRNSRAQWENVLNSKVWQVENDIIANELFTPLWLSYHDLGSQVKQCFGYCAVFPKDHLIVKDELIKLWMSQGYLMGTSTMNENMEVIGEEHFQNLVHRSFFQDVGTDFLDRTTCKMHDVVHDFAQIIARNECASEKANHPTETTVEHSSSSTDVRHLFVELGCDSLSPNYFSCLKKLRSLSIGGRSSWIEGDCGAALPFIFKEQTCLRCLSLKRCKISEIPSTIDSLKHLRFLDLSDNLFEELPASVCKLYNLQTLLLEYCTKLVKLPNEMGKLINLRHLSILYSSFDVFLPKGIGRLSSLRTLNYFMIGHDRDSCCLMDLKRLNNLSGILVIRNLGENAADVIEAREARLNDKQNISCLGLSFCEEEKAEREHADEELIEALEPPPNLEALNIWSYQGSTIFQVGCTRWMPILDKLKVIRLHNCIRLEYLPPLGHLPFLENLEIKEMHGVKRIGFAFLGLHVQYIGNSIPFGHVAFPKLLQLILSDMSGLEEWDFGIIDEEILLEEYSFGVNRLTSSTHEGENFRMKEEETSSYVKGLVDDAIGVEEGDSMIGKEAKQDVYPSGDFGMEKETIRAYTKEHDEAVLGMKEQDYGMEKITSTEAKKDVHSSGLIVRDFKKNETNRYTEEDEDAIVLNKRDSKMVEKKISTEARKDIRLSGIVQQDVGMEEMTSLYIKEDDDAIGSEEREWTSTKRKGDAISSIVIMPCITYLSVKNCPILKALPDQLLQRTTLKHLEIDGSHLLRERYNKEKEADWHKIQSEENEYPAQLNSSEKDTLKEEDHRIEDARISTLSPHVLGEPNIEIEDSLHSRGAQHPIMRPSHTLRKPDIKPEGPSRLGGAQHQSRGISSTIKKPINKSEDFFLWGDERPLRDRLEIRKRSNELASLYGGHLFREFRHAKNPFIKLGDPSRLGESLTP